MLIKCEREFISLNLDKRLRELRYSDILTDSSNAERIVDTAALSDEDQEISPLVGFYVPFSKIKKMMHLN